MKVEKARQLRIGTKIYLIDFDICAMTGRVYANIIQCEIRECPYTPGVRTSFHKSDYRGVTRWRSVNPKWCRETEEEARRDMNEMIRVIKEKLAKYDV